MGCGASKDPKKGREIQFEMKKVDAFALDHLYDRCTPALKSAEELREALQDARDLAIKNTGTHWLTQAHLNEAIRTLLWSISATNGGQIAGAEVNVLFQHPYFTVNKAKLTPEQIAVAEPLLRYFSKIGNSTKAVTESHEQLAGLQKEWIDTLKAEKDRIQGEVTAIQEEEKRTGKKDWARIGKEAKFAALNGLNGKNLLEGVKKMQDLIPEAQKQEDELNALLTQSVEYLKEADVMGKKAADEKVLKPREIFAKFHPGEKRDKKTVETEWGKDDGPAITAKKDEKKKDEKKEEKTEDKTEGKTEEKAEEKAE